MNHRYAYCSKDQDPDQDPEDMPLTPGTGNSLGGLLSDEIRLSMEDTQTPHSFLSDSSLDGAAEEIKEEEEEDGDAGVRNSPIQKAEEMIQQSPTKENGVQTERSSYNVENHIENSERKVWDRDTEEQNGDLDKCELGLDLTELPRITT